MLTGARVTGKALRDQRVVIHGAGAAGIGIARLLRSALERAGLRGEALTAAVANLDSRGLLVDDTAIADAHKREFAWPAALAEKRGLGSERRRDLLGVVRALKPTLLIGVCAERGAFSEPIVREMARHVERPLVFPMSNPTSCSEATPADVIAWTDGRALVATGSPFDPVVVGRSARSRSARATTPSSSPASGSACSSRKRTRSPTRCSSPPRSSWRPR